MPAMPAAPMAAMPATVPAPVAVVPVTVVPVMPVPVMSIAHLLRLETIDFVLCNDRGLGSFAARRHQAMYSRNRRQRRGVRGRSKCGGGGGSGKSNGEFQKVAAFHDISLSLGA